MNKSKSYPTISKIVFNFKNSRCNLKDKLNDFI